MSRMRLTVVVVVILLSSSSKAFAPHSLFQPPILRAPIQRSPSLVPVKFDCKPSPPPPATILLPLAVLVSVPSTAIAATPLPLSSGAFDPNNFRPVCSASDGFYRLLQSSAQGVIGPDNYVEYGPLIAGGLLRIRLELCVVESFFNEAVVPFIKQNGVSWVLPLHETVETFVAGTIFALASTFILVGSTKLVTVIVTYADLFVGAPSRLFGNFFFDR